MCHVGIDSGGVYHKMFALQQFLCEAECCAQTEGGVVHQRSTSAVPELVAAVVSCNHQADDETLLGVSEVRLQGFDDLLVRLPSCEADYVLWVWLGAVRRHHLLHVPSG